MSNRSGSTLPLGPLFLRTCSRSSTRSWENSAWATFWAVVLGLAQVLALVPVPAKAKEAMEEAGPEGGRAGTAPQAVGAVGAMEAAQVVEEEALAAAMGRPRATELQAAVVKVRRNAI